MYGLILIDGRKLPFKILDEEFTHGGDQPSVKRIRLLPDDPLSEFRYPVNQMALGKIVLCKLGRQGISIIRDRIGFLVTKEMHELEFHRKMIRCPGEFFVESVTK